jgi:hypothetical protein
MEIDSRLLKERLALAESKMQNTYFTRRIDLIESQLLNIERARSAEDKLE